ncbi:MAG TPA: DUF438 domain-containing protein [Thermoanaerobacterales bacterium]|nr:DUF438 domain-containing protein [Thermoanaerobacterales bacterium]
MCELITNREYRIKLLKDVIMDLHRGKSVDEVKERFREVVKDLSHDEVAAMEQALIQEGMPVEEIQRMCDVHASIFKESLESKQEPETAPGHPLHTFKLENTAINRLISGEILPGIQALKAVGGDEERQAAAKLLESFKLLMEVDRHYKRKENLLFPYLEKYGITAPPKVMWGVDDEIRGALKEAVSLLTNYEPGSKAEVTEKLENAVSRVQEMVFKEEKILFPMALQTLTEDEWYEIYRQSDEIGYCLVNPAGEWRPPRIPLEETGKIPAGGKTGDLLKFKTGALSPEEVELIFNHLPVDITFVDKNDVVKYFSAGKERIFTRTAAVIGRTVQNCHPPASVHVVERLLQDFKEGKKDSEEFWINFQGKLVYIRYFAVRDGKGDYVGTLEVTQEIGRIKELKGEKRLMD